MQLIYEKRNCVLHVSALSTGQFNFFPQMDLLPLILGLPNRNICNKDWCRTDGKRCCRLFIVELYTCYWYMSTIEDWYIQSYTNDWWTFRISNHGVVPSTSIKTGINVIYQIVLQTYMGFVLSRICTVYTNLVIGSAL